MTLVHIPCVGWDESLCAPSRFTILTGDRYQRHGCINIGSEPEDGSRGRFAHNGSQPVVPSGLPPYTPQECIDTNPGSPGHSERGWDWRKSWPWAVQQVGYQTAFYGKLWNSWPGVKGDSYTLAVAGVPIFDRHFHNLDDIQLGDQRAASGDNAYQAGQPYSEVDHSHHTDGIYFATAATPFNFNDQGTVVVNQVPASDSWNTPAHVGAAGYDLRQSGNASAHLADYYNRKTRQWLHGTETVKPSPPFVLYVCPRGSHNKWQPAQRHWSITPAGTCAAELGVLESQLGPSGVQITWTVEPDISQRDHAGGLFIMVGMETLKVADASIGTGAWQLEQRDVFNDLANAMPQTSVMPTWPAGTPVLQLSSSTGPDVGDDPSFNEADMTDKSDYWQTTTPLLTKINCVKARHDRIIKARCGMSHDELYYDILRYCRENFANPTVGLFLSDNGWAYGEHCDPSGKLEPYVPASIGPLFVDWPTADARNSYPYFDARPNIVFMLADDDDSKSLVSGYPLLATEVDRVESECVGWNGDLAATIIDLCGAVPFAQMDGTSLAPYASGARTGKSPRSFGWFNVQNDYTNCLPTFHGLYGTELHYWRSEDLEVEWPDAAAPVGVYPGIEEGYDLRQDAGELDNHVPRAGYTPAVTFQPGDLEKLRAAHAASLSSL